MKVSMVAIPLQHQGPITCCRLINARLTASGGRQTIGSLPAFEPNGEVARFRGGFGGRQCLKLNLLDAAEIV
jgi:hypothetical protein